MAFRLPKDARNYFKGFREFGQLDTLFDGYYLCLMAGLHYGVLGEKREVEDSDLTLVYPQAYRDKAPVIAGLLIAAEMRRKGIMPEDRASLERLMVDILDYQSPTLLTRFGHSCLDEYAAGGLRIIRDTVPRTSDLGTFLVNYSQYVLPGPSGDGG